MKAAGFLDDEGSHREIVRQYATKNIRRMQFLILHINFDKS